MSDWASSGLTNHSSRRLRRGLTQSLDQRKQVHIAAVCLFIAAAACYLAAFTGGLVVFVVLGLGLELAGLLGAFGTGKTD